MDCVKKVVLKNVRQDGPLNIGGAGIHIKTITIAELLYREVIL